ncbi:3-deoxy-7-phosphoheptulonate synthase [Burkholderia lata]|uniref:3-deoxy-7-phosphoheptulonate synthase n=1 Tax=Burkholderia lata (strain ATCC 17760 / DSM 23089 / LMG 22485 / NCIMB 9086 / R18194 / 383) TaxID=482957 RepID=UPI001454293F|nr:3-deoxy-7-phosphoheptulonate synthase [Burkholderia lata]VWC24102.1 phospho-2-dehydro-3-deoxyheptonate aldolase [Burkholderia lata]
MEKSDEAALTQGVAVISAQRLRAELPCDPGLARSISDARRALGQIIAGEDDRLALIVGPCSIHDAEAALAFARRLAPLRERYADVLEIVMRVYFEKPRTTVGWKGLLNDPYLDGSFRIEDGLRVARKVLLGINALGLPAATEFLDPMTAPYLDDLVSWGAIGARTTESQIHRQAASGLDLPVGFKNGTDGNVKVAIDAIRASRVSHCYLRPSVSGGVEIATTPGNPDTHVVLRGGKTPNYDAASVAAACAALRDAHLPPYVVVDASHGNSGKQTRAQIDVCGNLAAQLHRGERAIVGVMIESFLVEGRQDVVPGTPPVFGQSITDACLGWDHTAELVEQLAAAVVARRRSPAGFIAHGAAVAMQAVSY